MESHGGDVIKVPENFTLSDPSLVRRRYDFTVASTSQDALMVVWTELTDESCKIAVDCALHAVESQLQPYNHPSITSIDTSLKVKIGVAGLKSTYLAHIRKAGKMWGLHLGGVDGNQFSQNGLKLLGRKEFLIAGNPIAEMSLCESEASRFSFENRCSFSLV